MATGIYKRAATYGGSALLALMDSRRENVQEISFKMQVYSWRNVKIP